MPDPVKDVQGSQNANDANTPANQPDKQTTTQPRAEGSNLMDFLDIPAEVQSQVQPKPLSPMEGDIPASHPRAEETEPELPEQPQPKPEPEPEPKPQSPEDRKDNPDEDDDDDEDESITEPAPTDETQPQQKVDKRQKRINRLTRKLSERDSQIDTLFQTVTDLKGKVAKFEGKQESDSAAVPSSTGWLTNVTSERQLDQEVTKSRDLMNWCNANSEGVTQDDGDNQKFISPKEIAGWKTQAELVLLGAETRRREIREFTESRTRYDTFAKQAWPEMFDPKTEHYQLAHSLLEATPELKARADKNYALGILVEGVTSLHGRVQAAAKQVASTNGNGAVRVARDIDSRAFEPRVPLAPNGPELTPAREVVPSSHKKLNDAMTQLVADPDGSVGSLTKALSALDELNRPRAGGRTPVKV